jgi:hypothetical protein
MVAGWLPDHCQCEVSVGNATAAHFASICGLQHLWCADTSPQTSECFNEEIWLTFDKHLNSETRLVFQPSDIQDQDRALSLAVFEVA